MELHPFWSGFFGEIRKEALVDEAVGLAKEHPILTSAGVAAAGLGTIALGRRMGIPGFHRPTAAAASGATSGLKGKHMLLAGLGGAALGAYAMKKHKDKDNR